MGLLTDLNCGNLNFFSFELEILNENFKLLDESARSGCDCPLPIHVSASKRIRYAREKQQDNKEKTTQN